MINVLNIFSKAIKGVFETKEETNKIEVLQVRPNVIDLYRKTTKGNENLTDWEARCKLTVAWELARDTRPNLDRPERICRQYGNLSLVTDCGELVWIKNISNGKRYNCYIDKEKKKELIKALGIEYLYRNDKNSPFITDSCKI